jgi:D-serine deaminase-like pyridoxal phosphate-dependent protein
LFHPIPCAAKPPTLQDGHALARQAAADRRFAFRGLQGYAGHVQHIFDPAGRRAAAAKSDETLRRLAALLQADGIACPVISGSGTGSHAYDMDGPYTELQVGSYVFMDADYGRLRQDDGSPLPFAPALYVPATVVSANREDQVTVDAGTKALASMGRHRRTSSACRWARATAFPAVAGIAAPRTASVRRTPA